MPGSGGPDTQAAAAVADFGLRSGRALLWANLEADEVGKPAPFIMLFALLQAYCEVVDADGESMSGSLPRVVRAPEVLCETHQVHQSLLGCCSTLQPPCHGWMGTTQRTACIYAMRQGQPCRA